MMKKIMAIGITAMMLLVSFSMVSSSAFAEEITGPFAERSSGYPATSEIWDQEQIAQNVAIGPIGQSFARAYVAQRFTAGVSGNLLLFSVYIESFSGGGNFYYDIRSGMPSGGSVIGGFQAISIGSLTNGAWNEIILPAPLALSSGNIRSIVVTADPGTNFNWRMEDPGSYGGGVSYESTDDSTWLLLNGGSGDFMFRTYMEIPTGGINKVAWHTNGVYALGVTGSSNKVYKYVRNDGTWSEVYNTGTDLDHFKDIVFDDSNNNFYLVGESNGWPFAYRWSLGGDFQDLSSPPSQGGFYGVDVCDAYYDGTNNWWFVAVGQDAANKAYSAWWSPGYPVNQGWLEVTGVINEGAKLNDITFDQQNSHYAAGYDTGNSYGMIYEIDPPVNPAPSEIIDSSQESVGTDAFISNTGASWQEYAQRFTVFNTGDLTKVDLLLSKDIAMAVNLEVEIQQLTTPGGPPNGVVLASGSITPGDVPASYPGYAWVEVVFGIPLTVSAGQDYAIVLSIDTPNADRYWWSRVGADVYGPGEAWYNAGTWSQQAGFDFVFRVYTITDDPLIPPTATQLLANNGSYGIFNTITWCPDYVTNDYALLGGSFFGGAVSNIFKYRGTGFDPEPFTKTNDDFNDISWFPNGAKAVIVGDIGGSGSAYTHTAGSIIINDVSDKLPAGIGPLFGVACKGPSSPSSAILAGTSGAIGFFPSAIDGSTRITANAVFPKLYWIGFNDTTTASRLEQQVPVNEWYNFTLEANYSQGWSNCEVFVEAWYDWGATGSGSVYPAETDDNRNLAFTLNYSAIDNSYQILYPTGNLEVVAGLTATVTNLGAGVEDHRIVELPIYLGAQIRNATGNGFLAGETQNQDKNIALNDAWSWDFNVTVRDGYNPTAMEYSHAEFGIDKTVAVTVAGNPSGNTPPGSSNILLSNPSQITYSANTEYWVNVSIPNLLENGVGPASIDAIQVDVQNMDPYAAPANSGISAQTAIAGPGTDMYVWGVAGTPLPAPSNGTIACGEWVTDYNAAGFGLNDFTVLNWWITVPGATNEGVYWATITITIES